MRVVSFSAAVLAVGTVLACASQPPVARDDGSGARNCASIAGWLRGSTPGRAVYAGPTTASAGLGRIAERLPDENVGFVITDTWNGWLRVEGPRDGAQLPADSNRRMYSGVGWISGTGVWVGVKASQGFAQPTYSSESVLETAGSETLEDVGDIDAVVACDGDWVLARWKIREPDAVRYHDSAVVSRDPLVVEGWVTGICALQDTSCGQPSGDRPASVAPDTRR